MTLLTSIIAFNVLPFFAAWMSFSIVGVLKEAFLGFR